MGVLSETEARRLYTTTFSIVKGFPQKHFQLDCDNVVVNGDTILAFMFTERYKRKKLYYFATIPDMILKFGLEDTNEWKEWAKDDSVNKLDRSVFRPFSFPHIQGGIKQ